MPGCRGDLDMSGPVTYPAAARPHRAFRAPRRLLRRRRIALPAAVIVLAAAAAAAWFLTRPGSSASTVTSIVPVVRTTLSQTLSATGTIEPKKSATLSFSAAGQVTALEASTGERVVKGQPLASMDSPTLKAQAAQAEASLAGAQSQLSTDQGSSGAYSAQLAADQASVDAAQSQVDSANAALLGATLTAPFGGIVTGTGGLAIGQQVSGSGGGGGGSGSGSGSGDSGGHRVTRDVVLELSNGGLTQVTSGLAAGNRVVVTFRKLSVSNPGNSGVFIGPRGRVINVQGGPGGGPGFFVQKPGG